MKGKNIILLAVGAGIGSAVTWFFLRRKYERISREEIESVKEVYQSRLKEAQTKAAEEKKCEEVTKENDYEQIVMKEGYDSASNKPVVPEKEQITFPYVITPEQFGEHAHYKAVSLSYLEDDQLLVDDWGDTYDIDETIGEDALNSFGEYAEDCVHVRNNELKTDYEVTLDPRTYTEVFRKPN